MGETPICFLSFFIQHLLGQGNFQLRILFGLGFFLKNPNPRRTLPAFRENEKIFLSSKGVYSDEIPDDQAAEVIRKIDWWEYNRLK